MEKPKTVEEALIYCREVLGWKNACLPSAAEREMCLLDADAIYETKPENMWDTPRAYRISSKNII